MSSNKFTEFLPCFHALDKSWSFRGAHNLHLHPDIHKTEHMYQELAFMMYIYGLVNSVCVSRAEIFFVTFPMDCYTSWLVLLPEQDDSVHFMWDLMILDLQQSIETNPSLQFSFPKVPFKKLMVCGCCFYFFIFIFCRAPSLSMAAWSTCHYWSKLRILLRLPQPSRKNDLLNELFPRGLQELFKRRII